LEICVKLQRRKENGGVMGKHTKKERKWRGNGKTHKEGKKMEGEWENTQRRKENGGGMGKHTKRTRGSHFFRMVAQSPVKKVGSGPGVRP
jgi:hypothetical protein